MAYRMGDEFEDKNLEETADEADAEETGPDEDELEGVEDEDGSDLFGSDGEDDETE